MTTMDPTSWLGDRSDISLRIDTAAPGTALSDELIAAVVDVCDRVESGASDPIVVLHVTGARDGATTQDRAIAWPGEVGIPTVNRWERTLRRLERLPAAILAVAQGACSGPALEVLLCADYRIGTPDLSLQLPTLDGQVWPGMALHRLTTQIGVARTRRLAMFGRTLGAAQAERAGLIDEVADNLVDAVAHATRLIGDLAGSELAIRRRLVLDASTTSFEESLGSHLAACDRGLRRAAG